MSMTDSTSFNGDKQRAEQTLEQTNCVENQDDITLTMELSVAQIISASVEARMASSKVQHDTYPTGGMHGPSNLRRLLLLTLSKCGRITNGRQ